MSAVDNLTISDDTSLVVSDAPKMSGSKRSAFFWAALVLTAEIATGAANKPPVASLSPISPSDMSAMVELVASTISNEPVGEL